MNNFDKRLMKDWKMSLEILKKIILIMIPFVFLEEHFSKTHFNVLNSLVLKIYHAYKYIFKYIIW